jgi:glycolate oxidase
VRLCGEHDVPIVPRGAGSGLSGGAAGIEGALTIAFTRMTSILEIDRDNLTVTTQPGMINADLKKAVAAEGLFYAPDPASYEMCTIGGNLGTNAGGLCCVKYGVTRDAVLGLEVVMADATVLRLGGKNVKDVAGYGLIPLLVGSQGTLGLITEATLRLRPTPPPRATMLAFFPSLEAAGEAVAGMTAAGLGPVTLELMDGFTIRAVDDVHKLGLDRDAAAMLLVESDLPGGAATSEMDAAEPICEAAGATLVVRAADPQEADWLRQGRRLAFRALEHLGVARMEDVGVPRSRVPEMLLAIEGIGVRHRLTIGTFGHAGDGNLHPTFVLDRNEDEAASVPRLEAARNDLYEAALALGGTVTGEHGIGVARRDWLVRQRGEDAVAVMRAIKHALDPQDLLNPGRVLA